MASRRCTLAAKCDASSSPALIHRLFPESNRRVIRRLVQLGAAVDGRDLNGWTPLHTACFYKRAGNAMALLQLGASVLSVTATSSDGGKETPLHIAARCEMGCSPELVAVLLAFAHKVGKDVALESKPNGEGKTAQECWECPGVIAAMTRHRRLKVLGARVLSAAGSPDLVAMSRAHRGGGAEGRAVPPAAAAGVLRVL
jgi:hypothetical protein